MYTTLMKEKHLVQIHKQYKAPLNAYTMGSAALITPFIRFNSSSRIFMTGSQTKQAVVPLDSAMPFIRTGMEPQLAEHTFNIKLDTPGVAVVHSIIQKYPRGIGQGAITYNPLSSVIYQCQVTGEFNVIDITEYRQMHEIFGQRYKLDPIVRQLRKGTFLERDQIFAYSNNIHEDGYATTINAETAYIGLPSVIEDGFHVSDEFCERAAPLQLSSSVGSWGRKTYPLNLYGDENNYKTMADVNECIRDDGLVFAGREFNTVYDPVDMIHSQLRKVDVIHDFCTYGIPGATVHDIQVESGVKKIKDTPPLAPEMTAQWDRYIAALTLYYNSIVETSNELLRESKKPLGYRLQQLVVRAIADDPNGHEKRKYAQNVGTIQRTYKKTPLEPYRVEIFYNKRLEINRGSKITDLHAGKGVVCKVVPKAEMPTDADGNVADMAGFFKGGVSRLNTGQFYEQYINAASRDLTKWVRTNQPILPHADIWNKLMAYYAVTTKMQHEVMLEAYTTLELQQEHIGEVIRSGIHLTIPADEVHVGESIIEQVEEIIQPTYGPVSYIDNSGKRVTTKDAVLIGAKAIYVLEKAHMQPFAVSSSPLQHHGLPAGPTRSAKLSRPSKVQAPRVTGETEVRWYAATLGPTGISEILDYSTNPDSHRLIIDKILTSPEPMNIERCIDRKQHPVGNGRSLGFTYHILNTTGLQVVDGADNESK